MKKIDTKVNDFFCYKGKPLVRCKDTLYYGNMFDSHVVKIHIKKAEKNNNLDIASKASIQLISTDLGINIKDRIIKSAEKENLYFAMDIATAWLEKAISENQQNHE